MILGDHEDSKHSPEKKESQCIVCSIKERRRRTRTVCTKCNKGLHGECFPKKVLTTKGMYTLFYIM
jgi:hypothetical protein